MEPKRLNRQDQHGPCAMMRYTIVKCTMVAQGFRFRCLVCCSCACVVGLGFRFVFCWGLVLGDSLRRLLCCSCACVVGSLGLFCFLLGLVLGGLLWCLFCSLVIHRPHTALRACCVCQTLLPRVYLENIRQCIFSKQERACVSAFFKAGGHGPYSRPCPMKLCE